MNEVRNWILITLFFGFGLAAFLWFNTAPAIGGESTVTELVQWSAVFLVLVAFALAAFMSWYAFSNRDMNRLSGGLFPTALGTFMLVIPLVQFVALYMMANHIHKTQTATGYTGIHPVALFLLMWLLLPIGVIVAQVQMQRIEWSQEKTSWWQSDPTATAIPPTPNQTDESTQLWSPIVVEGDGQGARVRCELIPMPASGITASFFSTASLPLGLFGPAGIAAGLIGLYSRERFLDLEARMPGHRGGRVVSRLHWLSLVGIGLGTAVSAWMLFELLTAT